MTKSGKCVIGFYPMTTIFFKDQEEGIIKMGKVIKFPFNQYLSTKSNYLKNPQCLFVSIADA